MTAVWGDDVAEADLSSKTLPAVAAQIIQEINTALKALELPEISAEVSSSITTEITNLSSPEHKVRKIIRKAAHFFLGELYV